jgi:hypothetical protein
MVLGDEKTQFPKPFAGNELKMLGPLFSGTQEKRSPSRANENTL